MLTIEQLYRRLTAMGYRHRKVEELLRSAQGAPAPEVLEQMEKFLQFDQDAVFIAWFAEAHYKPHLRQAIIDCGEGAISSMLDYVRRLE